MDVPGLRALRPVQGCPAELWHAYKQAEKALVESEVAAVALREDLRKHRGIQSVPCEAASDWKALQVLEHTAVHLVAHRAVRDAEIVVLRERIHDLEALIAYVAD
mmetsp:Transcript_48702/g.104360  ORF Transcript_48702/g.104360 Transcript_48702/m.104360 type:complete len:105 (-) Transcript_48702:90-404(-)|eukprot:CAMPEP_0204328430 /NCGR_PEP_ID=MMETSP0469-20131031/13360_1 /ASSEMBLY_ACC=CAM_ASM_000384 /TAXON_ID=2969 /ORGANISM="Oxyrrhis marina" /LENGTH=104 /DNA_ID=CAMNT_0051310829 /DNA_START=49 /DNA_END=363 /DNA_ORIENTATION=+